MIALITYVVLAIGGMVAVHSIVAAHDSKVAAKEADVWKPQLDAEVLSTKTAVAANQSLKAQLDAQTAACTKATDDLAAAGAAAMKRKTAELAAAKAKGGEREKDQAQHVADSMKPAKPGESCETIVARRDAAIDAVGARRLRDFGAAKDVVKSPNDKLRIQ